MKNKFILVAFILFNSISINYLAAQIDSAFVEVYYITDKMDTVTVFDELNPVPLGAVTYRYYVKLQKGYRIKSLFGNEAHVFEINSTEAFYNHTDRGRAFGYDIRANNLDENTLALDSWLTIGKATTVHQGISKKKDHDGSILTENEDGMLKNNAVEMGIPLIQADGLLADTTTYTYISPFFVDTTIFDETNTKKSFSSVDLNNVFNLSTEKGVPATNSERSVLLFQLTTTGELSFTFNISVIDSAKKTIRLIGKDTLLNAANNELYNPYLSYPFEIPAGCTDPDYLEYDAYAVIDNGSCSTAVKFGCLDPLACNYDPVHANYHLEELCCFDGNCPLDLKNVCKGTVYGCMDAEAKNYNPHANSPDTCYYTSGCKNMNYAEYDNKVGYHDSLQCKVLVVYGCMDPTACNYNPVANRSIEEYKGLIEADKGLFPCAYDCSSGESQMNQNESKAGEIKLNVYPNPASGMITLEMQLIEEATLYYKIVDAYGKIQQNQSLGYAEGMVNRQVDVHMLENGLYLLKVYVNNHFEVKRFIKYE